MANLFTREEFAVWCQTPIANDDLFATMVMDQATALVVDAASAPGWELDPSTAPRQAKLIALRLARRTYLNPDQEISSSVGPISASILRDAAAGMMLTEDELATLLKLSPEGDPMAGTLWVQRTTRGERDLLPIVELPASTGGTIPYAYEGETDAFGELMSGEGVDPAEFAALQAQVTALNAALAAKAAKTYVDSQDATKASTTALTDGLALKADAAATTTALNLKADKTTTDGLDTRLDAAEAGLATKASQDDLDDLFAEVGTKADADAMTTALATKADNDDLGPQIELDDTQPASGSGKLWADTTGT